MSYLPRWKAEGLTNMAKLLNIPAERVTLARHHTLKHYKNNEEAINSIVKAIYKLGNRTKNSCILKRKCNLGDIKYKNTIDHLIRIGIVTDRKTLVLTEKGRELAGRLTI